MGVPSVRPSNTPDQISGASASSRCVVSLDCPGSAPLEVGKEVRDRQLQPGRAAVDDAQVAGAVAHAGGGHAEQLAEGVACHAVNYSGPPPMAPGWSGRGGNGKVMLMGGHLPAADRVVTDGGRTCEGRSPWRCCSAVPPRPDPRRTAGPTRRRGSACLTGPGTCRRGRPRRRSPRSSRRSSDGRFDYLAAHLLDPAFVDGRVADRARRIEPEAEAELTRLRDAQLQRRGRSRTGGACRSSRRRSGPPSPGWRTTGPWGRSWPTSVPSWRRTWSRSRTSGGSCARGAFADAEAASKATLPDVKDRAVFFRKVGDRWFIENRQAEEKAPAAAPTPP